MNVGNIADDITQVFGIPQFSTAPSFIQQRVLIDINAAIQQMQAAGEDYYGRETATITLSADTETYTLDDNVQRVLDHVKLDDGTLLRKLTTRGQLLQFGQLFFDQNDDDVLDDVPQAYYVESIKGTGPDEIAIIIHLTPKPDATTASQRQLLVPIIRHPTQLTLSNLTDGQALLPVPQQYVESIFLPLARWNAVTSFLFYEKEKIPRYEQEYMRAINLLGASDPRRPKPADSQSSALEIGQPSAQAPISPVQRGTR